MVNISGKVLIIAVTAVAILISISFLAATNTFGLGTAFSGFGGSIGAGIINILKIPFEWALSGGGPTIIGGWAVVGAISIIGALGVYLGYRKIKPATTQEQTNYQSQPTGNIPITSTMQSQPTTAPPEEKK